MQFSYILVDNSDLQHVAIELMANFHRYSCVGTANEIEAAAGLIMNLRPQLVLLRLSENAVKNMISCQTISDLFLFVDPMPYLIALAPDPSFSLDAIQSGFSDYIHAPLSISILGKSLFKFEKRTPERLSPRLCIKSYSDYHFVNLDQIIYLKADNNTTDIHLLNNKTVNAYKPLKHFENSLPFYFLRIHKSYIVNINHVSRIYFSKSRCYLNHNEILPFSLTYRNNIDEIIRKIES